MSTLESLFENFISQVRSMEMKSKQTVRGYVASFNLLQKFMLVTYQRTLMLSDLNKDIMVQFFDYLNTRQRIVGRGVIKTGVRSSTVATYRGKLDVFFEWLKQRGHLKENPFEGIPYPDVRYEDKKYLDKAELEKLLVALDHGMRWENNLVKSRNSAMITICCNMGLRKGELLGLELKDVDFKNGWIIVPGEISKSKRTKTLKMNPDVTFALQSYMAERNARGSKTRALWVSNNDDRKFTEGGFIHFVRRIKKEAGIERFHIHRLRHTFAVNYYSQNKDMLGLQKVLGHTDMDMTKKYLRGLPDDWTHKDLNSFSLGKAI